MTGPGAGPTMRARLSSIGEKTRATNACVVLIYSRDRWDLGRRWTLDGEQPVLIGRDPPAEGQVIVVLSDTVSRVHAKIDPRGRNFALVDLESTNGTYINDRLIDDELLRDGDRFKIGPSIFKFFSSGDVEAQYHEEIYNLIVTDPLTQAASKRHFLESLAREFARARRHSRPLWLVMFDIDHFKRINDELGHLAGDHVLRQLGLALQGLVRAEQCFARFGGEEFALILPEANKEQATSAAEKFRTVVRDHEFEFEGQRLEVRISAGVAELTPDISEPKQLLSAADAKLYEAKRAGRDRVVV